MTLYSVPGLLDNGHKTAIWKQIGLHMTENGCSRSPEQCKEKVHQHETCYKEATDKQRKPGETYEESCLGFTFWIKHWETDVLLIYHAPWSTDVDFE